MSTFMLSLLLLAAFSFGSFFAVMRALWLMDLDYDVYHGWDD